MTITEELKNYQPYDEAEARECEALRQFLAAFGEKAYERENLPGHFSASAWIVNPKRDKALMVYHNQFKSWTWPGGHAEGDKNLLEVAIKEVAEETGLRNIRSLQKLPIDINVLTVDNHFKHGIFVPRHLHFNLVYLFEADETEALTLKPDENSGVRWIGYNEINNCCLEDHIKPYYNRIIKKIEEREL